MYNKLPKQKMRIFNRWRHANGRGVGVVCDWELRELEHERVDATVALQGGFRLTCRKLDQTIVVLYSTETRWGFAYIPALWLEQDQVECSSAHSCAS